MRWLLIDRTAIGKAAYRRQTGGAPDRRPTSGYVMAASACRKSATTKEAKTLISRRIPWMPREDSKAD